MEPVAKTHRVGVGRVDPNSDLWWQGVTECDCGMFTVVYYLYNLLQLFIYAICLQVGNIWTGAFFFLGISIIALIYLCKFPPSW